MPPVRVLVVDDSVVVRRLVSDVLASDPEIEVVATASNGRLALNRLDQVAPDLVTLDIEMPELDGIATLREMRARGNRVPVIMFSTLTERGAAATLDALEAGASDYVTKPANVGSIGESLEQVRQSLVPKIKALVPRPTSAGLTTAVPRQPGAPGIRAASAAAPASTPASTSGRLVLAARAARTAPFRVLVVGCSTGGPDALARLLGDLPADLPVPVAVVQHMPPVFTKQFAMRLDRALPFRVVEAESGQVLERGSVYIAPGDHHLALTASGGRVVTALNQEPPENFCRPAVDVLFRTAARAYGRDVLGVVLTGMGTDGRRGSQDVVTAGGSVVVQDEATSVVWGMPGAVAQAGVAEEVLPLGELPAAITRRLARAGELR
ncbi:MAG: protein-glutamate methylesterase/protein-glutamine glutaminase [Angustibacter sp.]